MAHRLFPSRHHWIVVSTILLLLLFTGCRTKDLPPQTRKALNPATMEIKYRHLVYFTLEDKGDLEELLLDNLEAMAVIPSVADYWAGPAFNSNRPAVRNDFDLLLYTGFRSEKEYRAYLEHPVHKELADKWKPRLAKMLIHDVQTEDMEIGLDSD
ncbi:hypothetical protein GF324_00810 [bacterium]|nr:hypothetical protein [bacterium]